MHVLCNDISVTHVYQETSHVHQTESGKTTWTAHWFLNVSQVTHSFTLECVFVCVYCVLYVFSPCVYLQSVCLWMTSRGLCLSIVCGCPTVKLSGFGRILGGEPAPAGSFPWQVLLTGNGRGGGIVIGDRWIMTAAHVLDRYHWEFPKVSCVC